MKMTRIAAFSFLLAFGAAAPLRAQDAAKLAPADAGVFIELDGLAQWRADLKDDKLYKTLTEQVGTPDFWRALQTVMGLSGEDLFDKYFGKTLALVGEETGNGKPSVILSRVGADDIELALDLLQLTKADTAGNFTIYTNADKTVRLAFNDGWMAFAGPEHAEYMTKVLKQAGTGMALADDPTFKKWLAKLPAKRSGVLFARTAAAAAPGVAPGAAPNPAAPAANPGAASEIHALALTREGKNITLHYAGQPAKLLAQVGKIGQAKTLDFSPLPASTVIAGAFNIFNRHPADTRVADRVLQPKTLVKDVLPKLDPPILAFIGPLPEAKDAAPIPAVGLAIKMNDPTVAADLDHVANALVLMVNLKGLEWKADPVNTRSATHGKASYHLADVGPLLANRTGRQALSSASIVYGAVGDWYVLCTQESFFQQMIDQSENPALGKFPPAAFTPAPLKEAQTPIAAVVVRAPLAGSLLTEWAKRWKAADPDAAHAVYVAATVGDILQNFQTVSVQIGQGDGNTILGRMELIRP